MPETITIAPVDTLILSILVLAVGGFITRHVPLLERYAIPTAVTGGLLVSLGVLAAELLDGPRIRFDLQLRDLFLLAFFSTIGLSAKISRLKAGGKLLGLLVLLAAIGGRLIGERVGVLRPLPVYVLGGLSAMWCIERGLEVLA